jgi:hypothetical protein
MANPENVPDPYGFQVEWDNADGETVEATDVVADTTVRPLRESLRKRLRPPYNGQPFPPEVQAEIDRLQASAMGGEDDIVVID